MEAIEKILAKINETVKDLTVLEIRTVMGDMELIDGKSDFKEGGKVKGITSRIDLVDGDITTKISEDFYQKYPELVQWHQSRETKGHEIIERNIQTVVTIVNELRELNKQ